MPPYMDFDLPPNATFKTQEEMLAFPWIKGWSIREKTFSYYALSADNPYGTLLMAVLKNGMEWWVIGKITGDIETLTLPYIKYTELGYKDIHGKVCKAEII